MCVFNKTHEQEIDSPLNVYGFVVTTVGGDIVCSSNFLFHMIILTVLGLL